MRNEPVEVLKKEYFETHTLDLEEAWRREGEFIVERHVSGTHGPMHACKADLLSYSPFLAICIVNVIQSILFCYAARECRASNHFVRPAHDRHLIESVWACIYQVRVLSLFDKCRSKAQLKTGNIC